MIPYHALDHAVWELDPSGDVDQLDGVDQLWVVLVVEQLGVVGQGAAVDEAGGEGVQREPGHVHHVPDRAQLPGALFLGRGDRSDQ